MKKILFMVAAVALAMVSCNKEEITNNEIQEAPVSDIVFEAETPMTKTTIGEADENGVRPVSWVVGDKITINGSEFKASELKDNKAIFVTENLDFATAESYDAIYPAAAGTSLSAVTIAAKQDGTFANASISVAQSETQSLSFKNAAAMLKFQVPVACSSVTIESTAALAGTVSVSFDEDGNPVLGEVSDASNSIVVEASFVAGLDYYVAVLPGEHKFTVKINGLTSKASTKTSRVERAKLLNMNVLPDANFLYLVPNSNWKQNSRYAAYFFENGEKWVDMVKFTDNLYACEKQDGFPKVIFCRMNPSATANNWNNKWNQTGDMTIGTQKYCIIPFDVWDGSIVWSDNTTFDASGRYYLVPNDNWKSDSAWFATYFFNNSTNQNKWVKMTQFSSNPMYYEVVIPSGTWPNLIFCRMNKNNTSNMAWSNVWNQTSDLAKQSSNNFYTIAAGAWSKGSGSWSKK